MDSRQIAEAWFDPEIDQGFGLSGTLGVSGFPAGTAFEIGAVLPERSRLGFVLIVSDRHLASFSFWPPLQPFSGLLQPETANRFGHDANHLQSAKMPPRLASERGDLGHVLWDGRAAYFWSSWYFVY
jgi:hypothetical protein